MKTFSFQKMHGLGNDFMVVDGLQEAPVFSATEIAELADRHSGIGFDQLLLLLPSQQADLRCQIFNADGSEAEQCGNGMRCVARYVHEAKIIVKPTLSFETKAGLIQVDIQDAAYEAVRVNMGFPQLKNEKAAVSAAHQQLELTALSLGNPHAIARVENLSSYPLAEVANALLKHQAFPQGVNLGLIEVINPHLLRLRTHERGAGETAACGSNACAAAVAAITEGWLSSPVEVEVKGGKLLVEWSGSDTPVYLTGPASHVYSGVIP